MLAALSLSCHSSCKPWVSNLVFGTLAKSSIYGEASKEAFSSIIPAWLKGFVHIVEANNHLTLASLHINFCHAYVEPFCHDTRIKCRGISTRNWPRLAWENSQHFATPPLVSPRNDVWETNAEIPYWWRVTTQIWVVILIGLKFAFTNQKYYQDLDSDGNQNPSPMGPEVALTTGVYTCRGVFAWENSHRRESRTRMTFWFRIAFTSLPRRHS